MMSQQLLAILRLSEEFTDSHEAAILDYTTTHRCTCINAVIELDLMSSAQLLKFLSSHFSLPTVSLDQNDYTQVNQQLSLRDLVLKHTALPVHISTRLLTLAISDPTTINLEEDFRFATGLQINLVLCDHRELLSSIHPYTPNILHLSLPDAIM